jgi:hypothetical protein
MTGSFGSPAILDAPKPTRGLCRDDPWLCAPHLRRGLPFRDPSNDSYHTHCLCCQHALCMINTILSSLFFKNFRRFALDSPSASWYTAATWVTLKTRYVFKIVLVLSVSGTRTRIVHKVLTAPHKKC